MILLVEKFKGTMRKLELLMPLSFHMPVISCCLGTAQPELMLDSKVGQACKDAGTDSRLQGNKAQENEYVTIYMNMTYDTRY